MSEVRLAVCAIADIDKHIMLLQRRDPLQWQLPGGRIEPGEVPAQAAIRETYEELDITVTALHRIRADMFTQGDTSYFYELFQVTNYEGMPRLMEPGTYKEFGHINLYARRVGELVLSPIVQDFSHLLQNEELRLEH